jgi:hypothetical protein
MFQNCKKKKGGWKAEASHFPLYYSNDSAQLPLPDEEEYE